MSRPDGEFVTLLLRRDPDAPGAEQEDTVHRLTEELRTVPGVPGLTPNAVLPGWQVVGFGWGNEFDDRDGDDE